MNRGYFFLDLVEPIFEVELLDVQGAGFELFKGGNEGYFGDRGEVVHDNHGERFEDGIDSVRFNDGNASCSRLPIAKTIDVFSSGLTTNRELARSFMYSGKRDSAGNCAVREMGKSCADGAARRVGG